MTLPAEPMLKDLNRTELLALVESETAAGELSLGAALKILRKHITGLNQAEFAQLCGISRRTLAALEADEGNPTLQTVNQVLKLFGLRLGLTRIYQNRHK
ncbi:helix-turn-helix domain-containing protein [Thalassolituus marinus]|uniref:Helix-turn-helix domain-containing protein n=1 Tax=Thalassolituus marinus TaxID=671053 RepID=A0ABS7ZL56_9GAMM|nr:helix-turn-helix transcriptional regulator [Thalassolituus marinus]MCA6062459.1 helix-turn-helix domain-containing protein [Thalassolituus marinus]